MFKRRINTIRFGAAAILSALAVGLAPFGASALQPVDQIVATPITPALIERVKAALAQCKYGFMRQVDGEPTVIAPSLLTPTLEAMGRKSAPELSRAEVWELYEIAQRLMQPALPSTKGIPDALSRQVCPAQPEDAAAIFEYLIAHEPDKYRGPSNILIWLARAYESGTVGSPDREKARSYHLRWEIHSKRGSVEDWSDGIDDTLIGNIDRAGLRPYLESLAEADHSSGVGTARMILAAEAIDTAPERARWLLMYDYGPALNLLLQYENEGRLTIPATREDIAFWAGVRKGFGDQKKRERMLKAAALFNGGPVPTQATEPDPKDLARYVSLDGLYRPRAFEEPVPIRVLVDTEGRAIHGEPCRATSEKRHVMAGEMNRLVDAVQAYKVSTLPQFPVYRRGGRSLYSWVVLPAIAFEEVSEAVLAPSLTSIRVEQCKFADIPGETLVFIRPPSPPPHAPKTGS